MVKLNTDGSFVNSQEEGIGMILRDHRGAVIVTASKRLQQCADATDAELAAIEEGLAMALNWTALNMVKTDCAQAIHLINRGTPNTSIYASRIQKIREFLRESDIPIAKILHEANCASHELAKIGRVEGRTETWFDSFPSDNAMAVAVDCNSAMI
jgi:ribonuclease HI